MASTTPSTSPSLPDEVTTRILSLILSFIVSEKNRNFAFLARHTHSVLAISNILSVTPANAADARLVCAKNNFLGPEELGFQWLTFREKRFESLTESVAVRVRRPGGVEERNKEGVSLGGLVEALALREEKKRSSGVKDNGGTKKRKRFLERREFDYDENIGREFLEFNFAGNEYVIPALATDGAATPNSTESTDSIATTASSQSIASVCQELEIEHIDALDTNDGSWVHLPTWYVTLLPSISPLLLPNSSLTFALLLLPPQAPPQIRVQRPVRSAAHRLPKRRTPHVVAS
ncbi:unnamed protein product [Periconia digitata]|uniref:Uncharacterized protein n=1 Tax=Periconia digitata TaxID=1303443 RepID=A0A9W4U816_9PLEO|nr:unnamed protein product [Periconia digitata]